MPEVVDTSSQTIDGNGTAQYDRELTKSPGPHQWLSKGMPNGAVKTNQFSAGQRTNTIDSTVTTEDLTGPWTSQFVLSLDGGGVKGYSALLILEALMQEIHKEEDRQHSPDDDASLPPEQRRPCIYFDYMFGTSTGGLIAIMLGRLRLNVSDALQWYRDLAGTIFRKPRFFSMYGLLRDMYDHKVLKDAFQKVVKSVEDSGTHARPRGDRQQVTGGTFHSGLTFDSDPIFCRTVCVAYGDIKNSRDQEFLFRSYEHHPDTTLFTRNPRGSQELVSKFVNRRLDLLVLNPGPAHALPIWQVARATSAATCYFKPMRIDDVEFVDGGLGCNNPAFAAFTEVTSMHNESRKAIKLLLSVGTGQKQIKRIARGHWARRLQLLRAAIGVMTNAEDIHKKMERLAAALEDSGFRYHRLNVEDELGSMDMASWKQQTPEKIERLTQSYLDSKTASGNGEMGGMTRRQELKEIAKTLVEARRERALTRPWPQFSTATRYRCAMQGCHNGHRVHLNQEELWRHFTMEHQIPSSKKLSDEQRRQVEKVIHAGRLGPLEQQQQQQQQQQHQQQRQQSSRDATS